MTRGWTWLWRAPRPCSSSLATPTSLPRWHDPPKSICPCPCIRLHSYVVSVAQRFNEFGKTSLGWVIQLIKTDLNFHNYKLFSPHFQDANWFELLQHIVKEGNYLLWHNDKRNNLRYSWISPTYSHRLGTKYCGFFQQMLLFSYADLW